MSKITMNQILADTEAYVKNASAQFKKDAAFHYAPATTVGGDGSGMPGSDSDKPIPAGAKAPHPEVAQGLPAGAQTGGGSNSEKLEAAHALDATQPVAKPDKEPLVSSDANAEPKTGAAKASLIANDLLGQIRQYQEEVKNAAAPAAAPKAAAAVVTGQVELTQDVLSKIASVILATEDGVKFAEAALTKAAGAEAAHETFEFLQKQAAYAQGSADADAMIADLVAQDQAVKQAQAREYATGQNDAVQLIKLAVAKAQANRAIISAGLLTKLGQEVADESIGDGAGAPGADAGGVPPEMGSAPLDEEISPEELEQALAELVQEGQLTPEAAQAIVQAIQQAEQGGGEGGGEMPPEAGGADAGGMPPEAVAPGDEGAAEEAAKQAMAKRASALVKAIQSQKAAQAGK